MGIGGSHESKEEEKGFPSKHIFSPVGSPPPLDFFPPTSKARGPGVDDFGLHWNRPTEPVVFRWHHKGRDRVPREVLLHGQWDDDHPVKLVPDTEAPNANNPERQSRRVAGEEETVFMTIINLPPGTYSYDFMVDGKVCLAPDQPIVNNRNIVTVLGSDSYGKQSSLNAEEEGWGQEIPDLSSDAAPPATSPQKPPARRSKNTGPVELPAHLERALLNSQPVADDPSMLPLPHHVMLNHLYSRPSLYNTYILGLTVRHRENFVTVVLYKPTDSSSSPSPVN